VKDFQSFRNRRDNRSSHPVLSKHMFSSRDDDWKRIRAIASPAFTSGKLKKMYSLINECCEEYMKNLDDYAKDRKEIEIKQLHGAYTMDVIAKCAFATNTNSHKDPENEFTKNAFELTNLKFWKFFILFLTPSFLAKIARHLLNIGNSNLEFFLNVGRQLLKQRKDNKEKYNDFFQLLMDVERNDNVFSESDDLAMNHLNEGKDEINANTKAFSNVLEKKLTEDEILAQCWLFFVAGFETTATTLSFLSYELAIHPEIQEKLYEEIKPVFNGTANISYETLLKLPYLDSVFSESLRKYPIVMRLERQAMDDIVLSDTGIMIPKGNIIEIPVYAIHYDPENYPNPQEFIPERFMPENRSNIKPYTYLPFGTGPRNCIGMRFALLEAKLALVNIIYKYRFFKTPNTDIPLQMAKGLHLIKVKRIFIGIERR
jgi:cytochrome P450